MVFRGHAGRKGRKEERREGRKERRMEGDDFFKG